MVTKPHKSAERKRAPRPVAGRVLTEAEVLDWLRQVGAIIPGHFVLSSGRHSDLYVEKFRALEVPPLAMALGTTMAARFAGRRVDVVLAPALGAIVLGFATALAAGARFIFAERDAGRMRLRRGFAIHPGEQVLVVEDVVTTGASLREVLALVPEGALAGAGCLLDRSGSGAGLGDALVPLARLDIATWEPQACPRCAAGEPAVAPGSRHLT
jgi:orotate phosphoribosyltransferase